MPQQRATPESLAAERAPTDPWAHSLHRGGETSADMKLPLKLRFRLRGDSSFITPNECGVMIMKEPPERAALFTPVAPDPNRFTVQVHADPTSAHLGNKQLNAKDLADIIRGTPGYVPGTPVRMVACEAGQPIADGSPNLAQQLSRHLGVEVLAGDRTIWANRDGISTAQGSQMRLDRFGVPTPHLDQPGRWHVFQPDGTPPVTHNSPVPPGHVSEFQKARWHSDRNLRSGTWHPGDPYLPVELRHPGGGPDAEPAKVVDGNGNSWQGHVGPCGQPVWHGYHDRSGNWVPTMRVDQQGRSIPCHVENGRLVDNGRYTPDGGWVGHGRMDTAGRWVPIAFDGSNFRETGRYDANGRWFPAGHFDGNGLWRPHGRFHPDSGRWLPDRPTPASAQPGPGQRPHPGQGPHPDQRPVRDRTDIGPAGGGPSPADTGPRPDEGSPPGTPRTASEQGVASRTTEEQPRTEPQHPARQQPPAPRVRPDHGAETPRPAVDPVAERVDTRPAHLRDRPLPEVPKGTSTQQRLEVLRAELVQRRADITDARLGEFPGPESMFGVRDPTQLTEAQSRALKPKQDDWVSRRNALNKELNELYPHAAIPKDVSEFTPSSYRTVMQLARDHGVPLVDASPTDSNPLPAAADPDADIGALRGEIPGVSLTTTVETLFRADNRSPSEIVEAGGFLPFDRPDHHEGGDYDLAAHQEGNRWSRFVSTTPDYQTSREFVVGRGTRFVYTIEAAGAVDLNRERAHSQYSDETERAFAGGVKLENVTGVFVIEIDQHTGIEGKTSWVPRERFGDLSHEQEP